MKRAVVRVSAGLREFVAERAAGRQRVRLEQAVFAGDDCVRAFLVLPRNSRAGFDRERLRLELLVRDRDDGVARRDRRLFRFSSRLRSGGRDQATKDEHQSEEQLSHFHSPLKVYAK